MLRKILLTVLTLPLLSLASGCQDKNPLSSDDSMTTQTSPTPLLAENIIIVPHGKSQAIDGEILPGEWDNAIREIFKDGSELCLMNSDGYLYMALRANSPDTIVGNIFIDQGDKILILHASAALGTGIYQKESDQWQLTQGFVWSCRDTSDSEAAQNERKLFLQDN